MLKQIIKQMWAESLGDYLRQKPADYRVDIKREGPGGTYFYVRDSFRLPFGYDLSGFGVTIGVPREQDWNTFVNTHGADWARGKRVLVMEQLAKEVKIKAGFDGDIKFDEAGIDIYAE